MAVEPWELHPYKGAGPLRFGMSRADVIKLLGEPRRVIHQAPTLVESNGDVHPGYDGGGRLIMLHTAGSALVWHGITLTDRPLAEVARDLAAAGIESEPDGEELGLIAPRLGIELYAPDDEDYWPRRVQGVLVKSHAYEDGDPA